MPVLALPYGDSTVEAELPERTRLISRSGGERAGGQQPLLDEAAAVREALERPLGLPRIREMLRPGARVVIAFDDPTVTSYGPIRRHAIEAVLAECAAAGVAETDVTLICANALHRKFTRDEVATIIGRELVDRFGARLFCHDAEDRDQIVDLGATGEHGYDVEISRHAAEADLCVYVNAGLHLGFSGGWKSVTVGLSTWRSIRHTHHPDGMSMSVLNNRMHQVLDEMGAHLERRLGKRIYKIECVQASPTKIARVWAGGVAETRAAALEVMAARTTPRRAQAEPADVVVYGVPAWSPYAAFAKMNPILTLISSGLGYLGGYIEALGKPGCTVVMATPCPEEWDMEHHPAYLEVWDHVLTQTQDPYEIQRRWGEQFATNERYIERYRNGVAFHPVHAVLATHPLRRLKHASRVIVAGSQDPLVPSRAGFDTSPTVEDAVRSAEREHGAGCSIVCVNN